MRHYGSWVAGVVALWVTAAVVVGAQAKMKAEDLDRIMKKDGPAQQALVKAVIAENVAAAKTQAAALKAGLEESEKFWAANKRADALDINKAVQTKLANIQKLLDAPKFDAEATKAAVQDMNKSCTECHRIYRVQDDDGRFVLKPGSVPGM